MGILSYFRHLDENTQLMQKMFAKVGIIDWFAQDPHGPEVLRRAAMRCGTCDHVEECVQFLETHETASHTPGFCRNHDLVERITREMGVRA